MLALRTVTYCTENEETPRLETVEEFLAGGSLLANLFLHLEVDPHYWLAEVEQLKTEIG